MQERIGRGALRMLERGMREVEGKRSDDGKGGRGNEVDDEVWDVVRVFMMFVRWEGRPRYC